MNNPNAEAEALLLQELGRRDCPMNLKETAFFLASSGVPDPHRVAKELSWKMVEYGQAKFTGNWSIELKKPEPPPALKFYLATGLDNSRQAAEVIYSLENAGMHCTFNWVQHGSESTECARQEIEAIKTADVLVWIPWNSRGNHIEYGAALASGTPVVMFTEELRMRNIPFYGLITHRVVSVPELIDCLRCLQPSKK